MKTRQGGQPNETHTNTKFSKFFVYRQSFSALLLEFTKPDTSDT